ncbi:uncharacterized protein CTRU02_202539 [Colletotrichum truncatum]|uniref:Uncharacterized protein n=1 Tax=Colletotrichum truncatum TaxID=5467 RepID=A0ACC3ZKJ1_COLTU|nr:uncharacterized protein CTRU02_01708 [Colletotrichum truncatum]KAF6800028.1 hypothetical protein CTRU02_01708 [Colletotrichum truncatum]
MCEDGKSEGTADAGVASSRVQPPSTGRHSGRNSSRLPSPDSVLFDPDFAPGRRVTRNFLAESLMDMHIPPRTTPSPLLGRKRSIDEVVDDSTPPSPDKLLRELDQQHQEAKEARRTPVLPQDTQHPVQVQATKRQKMLAIRGSNPNCEMASTSAAHQSSSADNGESSSRHSSASPVHHKS